MPPTPSGQPGKKSYRPIEVTTYDYRDEHGELRYQAQRHQYTDDEGGKKFTLRRADGNGGWVEGPGCMKDVERLPYRLTELLAAPMDTIIFLAEGEKNVEDLRAHGLTATCNSEGATKFRDELVPHFEGRTVVALEDNDKDGRRHTAKVAPMLSPVTEWVKILALPGLPEHGDVSDWFAQGHTVKELMELVKQTPSFQSLKSFQRWGVEENEGAQNSEIVTVDTPWDGEPEPWPLNDVPIFPTEVLPNEVRLFVEAQALELEVPADLIANFCFGVTGVCAARRVVVRINAGWKEPLNIYNMTILKPSERKSPAERAVKAPIVARETTLQNATRSEVEQNSSDLDILKGQLEKAKRTAMSASTTEEEQIARREVAELSTSVAEFDVLSRPQLLVDDVTPEALASRMHANGERMGIITSEGGVFGIINGRYNNGAPNTDIYTKSYLGDRLGVDRQDGRSLVLEEPALTLSLAVQPIIVQEDLTLRQRGVGLLARFLYSLPISMVGNRTNDTPTVPESVRVGWHKVISKLAQLPEPPVDQEYAIILDSDAHRLLYEFRQWIEGQLVDGGELKHIEDWGGKIVGNTLRLAGHLHLWKHYANAKPWEAKMTGDTLSEAIALGKYYREHALVAFSMMGGHTPMGKMKQLLGIIHRKFSEQPNFSESDLRQITRWTPDFKNKDETLRLLSELADMNHLRRVVHEVKAVGRKPSPRWQIHPDSKLVATSINSINSKNSAMKAPSKRRF